MNQKRPASSSWDALSAPGLTSIRRIVRPLRLKPTSLRFLAATAAIQGFRMRRFDFVSAFFQGDLEQGELILCRPPPGYETIGRA